MTDKDKMRADFEVAIPKFEDHDGGTAVYFTDEEYEEVAWPVWKAAKESSRKELEAAKADVAHIYAQYKVADDFRAELKRELEARDFRKAEYAADMAIKAKEVMEENYLQWLQKAKGLEAEKEALEKKQAGRDELQKVLSEQEPVAWLNPVSLLPYDNKWNAGNEHPEWIALIPRPLPPQVKGE